MDFWAQRCLEEIREAEEQKVAAAGHTTDRAMADTVMDFLFASQDATTSAVVWVTVLMADHPDVLHKVRALCHLVTLVSDRPSWVSQIGHATLLGGGGGVVILLLSYQGPSDSMHWQLQALQHEIPLSLCASQGIPCFDCCVEPVLLQTTPVQNTIRSLLRSMSIASLLLMLMCAPANHRTHGTGHKE